MLKSTPQIKVQHILLPMRMHASGAAPSPVNVIKKISASLEFEGEHQKNVGASKWQPFFEVPSLPVKSRPLSLPMRACLIVIRIGVFPFCETGHSSVLASAV